MPMHRISSSIVEHGVARLVYSESSQMLKGVLLNHEDESFSIKGCVTTGKDQISDENRRMRITIVDDETGEKFCIEGVQVQFQQDNSLSSSSSRIVIETPAIKFRTEEILIGNRADVEIRRYLDPSDPMMRSNGEKSPERRTVHVGKMQLRVIASQPVVPNPNRRTSISQPDASVIEWAQEDFLI